MPENTLKVGNSERSHRTPSKTAMVVICIGILAIIIIAIVTTVILEGRAIARQEQLFNNQQMLQVLLVKQAVEGVLNPLFSEVKLVSTFATPDLLRGMDQIYSSRSSKSGDSNKLGELLALIYFSEPEQIISEYTIGTADGVEAKRIGTKWVQDYWMELNEGGAEEVYPPFHISSQYQMLGILVPIKAERDFQGVLAAVVDLKPIINRFVTPVHSGINDSIFLLDGNGVIVYDFDNNNIGREIFGGIHDGSPELLRVDAREINEPSGMDQYKYILTRGEKEQRVLVAWNSIQVGDQKLIVSLSAPDMEINRTLRDLRTQYIMSGGVFVLFMIMIGVAYFIFQRQMTEQTTKELQTQVAQRTADLSTMNVQLQREINNHRTARAELQQQKSLSENIIQTASAIILMIEEGNRITLFNDYAETLTGFDREEVLGRSWLDVFIPAAEHDTMKEVFTKMFNGENRYLGHENTILCKNGSERLISWRNSLLKDVEERTVAILSVGIDITERKLTNELLQSQIDRLDGLREIDKAIISANVDLPLTLNLVIQQVVRQLGVDAATLLLYNSHSQALEYAANIGFRTDALRYTRLEIGQGYAGQAALERRVIYIEDLRAIEETNLARSPLLTNENFISYLGVPLIAKNQIQGVLEIFHRELLKPKEQWFSFMETLAGQAAIALDNAALFRDLHEANINITLSYDATIEGWARALELRDMETEGHSRRVTDMTLIMAVQMGIRGEDLVHLRRGALLHDIGKMAIPDSILLKPGQLSPEEWDIMHQHPGYAYDLLMPIDFLKPALDIPYCHHEKWDGTGYPRRLKGEEIPIGARIFAVIDIWDSLMHERPYKEAWSLEQTNAYLIEQRGKHLDPKVVDVFLENIKFWI